MVFKIILLIAVGMVTLYLGDLLEMEFVKRRRMKYVQVNKDLYILGATTFIGVFTTVGTVYSANKGIYVLFMLTISALTAVIDMKYRIIPNKLVLLLLIVQCGFLATGYGEITILNSILGLLCTALIFIIPGFFGKNVGAGDIKLAGAVGFCCGVINSLYIVVIMGGLILAYTYLKQFNLKLALKSYVPMAPFIMVAFMMFIALGI